MDSAGTAAAATAAATAAAADAGKDKAHLIERSPGNLKKRFASLLTASKVRG